MREKRRRSDPGGRFSVCKGAGSNQGLATVSVLLYSGWVFRPEGFPFYNREKNAAIQDWLPTVHQSERMNP